MRDTLPDLPSALLEKALADLDKCRAQPGKYVIDMDTWAQEKNNRCHVCLAGACLMQSLNFPLRLVPVGWVPLSLLVREDHPAYVKLAALDLLRKGLVADALRALGHPPARMTRVEVTHYCSNPDAFLADMRKVVSILKQYEQENNLS